MKEICQRKEMSPMYGGVIGCFMKDQRSYQGSRFYSCRRRAISDTSNCSPLSPRGGRRGEDQAEDGGGRERVKLKAQDALR
ncbi:hypothetical protein CEXT_35571 [Caerostris extrusa]|uniref:Uncharacterized protein n=1 Tax=Caerostris extrusa TaxID=172846 RepID=A0AAV4X4H9_CAEEX|nr:hypothetical protein CEXT_35571 [Caerostris extrusa]